VFLDSGVSSKKVYRLISLVVPLPLIVPIVCQDIASGLRSIINRSLFSSDAVSHLSSAVNPVALAVK
jgi:hypothetical protein